ncbi:MAG: SpoIVB peptidase S55 domain-containing protein [Candidatus Bipolaricaulota bacterium]
MRCRNVAVGLIFCFLSLAGAGAERSEFLFLDEVHAGMTGIGKTIVAGDTISEFAVEILGVIDEPGDLRDFIVVRVSGEAIGRSGGIAQGMSGSPIYVGGKLIGALSRAAAWSKEITPIGLVTPIEPMLAVLDAARRAVAKADPASLLHVDVVACDRRPSEVEVAAHPEALFSYPVATPLLISGLSERAAAVLLRGAVRPAGTLASYLPQFALAPSLSGFASLGLEPLPLAASPTAGSTGVSSLVPGGGIGLALATGDVTVGALGTVTYREGDAVIGFGHPFLSNGASDFPLTTVSIFDTMKSYDASFKLGTLGTPLGTINEDRTAAIGGLIGTPARTIGLDLDVLDLDRDVSEHYSVELVNEARLVPELLLSVGLEAIDTALDRIGPGTVEVTYQIVGDAMPSTLERKDIFLSTSDIAVYPPWQLADLVAYLEYNEFTDPELSQISASMRVTREIRAIFIEDLEIDAESYAPGDAVLFELTLQTWQGERIVLEDALTIPPDLVADSLFVRAYSGPRVVEEGEEPVELDDLADVIDLIESLPSYETLTVELFAEDWLDPLEEGPFGVTAIQRDYPGFVVYGEIEVSAMLSWEEDGEAGGGDDGTDGSAPVVEGKEEKE